MWLFDFSIHVPSGSYPFRVNTPETSLFQNILIKMMQKWQVGGFGLFEYELFFFSSALVRYVDINCKVF